MVLKDVSVLLGGGLIIGLAAGVAILTLCRSLLLGIRMADPWVIGAAMIVFLLTSVLAASLPAHRAATVDPMVALRQE